MKNLKIICITFFVSSTASALSQEQVQKYDQRYQLQNLNQKLVDNRGDGYENLYGVRNFRQVLRGILYRGGANNKYNKYGVRDNQNPLPDLGLKNLCSEGFAKAVYLYSNNFSKAPKQVICQSIEGNKNQLQYQQVTATGEKNTTVFLKMVYDAIKEKAPSPIYMHCWNGWHASGLVSALSLRQFCGMSAQDALAYWDANTDGNTQGYDGIKKRILNFKPLTQFQITEEERRQICF